MNISLQISIALRALLNISVATVSVMLQSFIRQDFENVLKLTKKKSVETEVKTSWLPLASASEEKPVRK